MTVCGAEPPLAALEAHFGFTFVRESQKTPTSCGYFSAGAQSAVAVSTSLNVLWFVGVVDAEAEWQLSKVPSERLRFAVVEGLGRLEPNHDSALGP